MQLDETSVTGAIVSSCIQLPEAPSPVVLHHSRILRLALRLSIAFGLWNELFTMSKQFLYICTLTCLKCCSVLWHCSKAAEQSRRAKYAHLDVSHHFVPLAVETSGVLGPEALLFLQVLGHRLKELTGEPRSYQFLLTVDDISEIMSDLNPNKSTGPDTIPPGILKCSKPVTSTTLCHIVNSSLRTGSFPNQWKHATVIPLHKGGNKLELRNYWPISLLPVSSKLIERVVSNQLTSHLESNQLLYRHQSGFRRLHSTTTTLLHATYVWSQALDNGMCIGVLFLDVAKAFDSVNHSTLLGKLPNFGFDQSTITWF